MAIPPMEADIPLRDLFATWRKKSQLWPLVAEARRNLLDVATATSHEYSLAIVDRRRVGHLGASCDEETRTPRIGFPVDPRGEHDSAFAHVDERSRRRCDVRLRNGDWTRG